MPARELIEALGRAGRTLAVAESFTGGRIADRLTAVPGASRVFRGGIVAYSDHAKRTLLGVPEGILITHGAVSGPVSEAMARGALAAFGADLAIATTGIAGPTGATLAKPVGTAFAAAAGPSFTLSQHRLLEGGREAVRTAAAEQALALLQQRLAAEGIL